MAHPTYKDAGNNTRSRKGSGAAGNDGDPDVFFDSIDAITTGASADIGNSSSTTAITSDAAGSMIGFLRGLVKWAFERMPAALGQGTMSQSLRVVLPSDQSGIPLSAGTAAIGGVKLNGPQWTRGTLVPVDSANASAAAVDLSLAPTSGQKIVIDSLFVSVGGTLVLVTIKDEDGVVLFKLHDLAAGDHVEIRELTGMKLPTADKKLQLQTSAAGDVFAVCSYHSEA